MTDEANPTISQIMNLLNDWRHLPSYSLETRAAPFFAVFMRGLLSEHFHREIHEILIPEFPLRIGTLYNKDERKELQPEPSADQSYNVDYVAFAKDKKTAYLVELKTDMRSLRSKQNKYLLDAREQGLPALVEGVKKLSKKSDKKQKYVHLLHRLAAPGIDLVTIPDDTRLYEKTFRRSRVVAGWTPALKQLTVNKQHFPKTMVVFVQPVERNKDDNGFEHIYFAEVANRVERRGDLGALFANYLRQWTSIAGNKDPRDI